MTDNIMTLDKKNIETLVEIITHEVLKVFEERELKDVQTNGQFCKVEYADNIRVTTCFDNAGHVVSAGADRITSTLGNIPDDKNLAALIDHTLLKADATSEQIAQLCEEARKYNFASVCVNPAYVKQCAELLRGSEVMICSVIGFPLGASSTDVKVFEAKSAIEDGASEIDMVINIGALKTKNMEVVANDIREVVIACHSANAIVKVIIETALLTEEEKILSCLLAKEAGADFVKTSTGFSTSGATVEDVALMRRVVGPEVGIKAAGGIRTLEDLEKMVKAGATRIGASAGVKIIKSVD